MNRSLKSQPSPPVTYSLPIPDYLKAVGILERVALPSWSNQTKGSFSVSSCFLGSFFYSLQSLELISDNNVCYSVLRARERYEPAGIFFSFLLLLSLFQIFLYCEVKQLQNKTDVQKFTILKTMKICHILKLRTSVKFCLKFRLLTDLAWFSRQQYY